MFFRVDTLTRSTDTSRFVVKCNINVFIFASKLSSGNSRQDTSLKRQTGMLLFHRQKDVIRQQIPSLYFQKYARHSGNESAN